MENQIYETMFNEEEQFFTGEEITTFKRYIEENNVCNENNFEYLEGNLSYYSSRYTRESYSSPYELFQVNSNYTESDEMKKNIELYNSSIDWYSKTVHPEDSEYVVKEEKYIFTNEVDDLLKNIIEMLNNYPKADYQCVDILIYYKKDIFKYLSHKNFVFRWRKGCTDLIDKLVYNNFFQSEKILLEDQYKDSIIVFPILIPIRKALFLGEYGYRSSMVDYGRVVERISVFLNKKGDCENLERFDNVNLNNLLGLDGIEKSIYNILILK